MYPKISVIIPAYNAESTICRAVDSALNQLNVEVEVIVVDDCSQDATVSVINNQYSQNERVKLFRTVTNSGPSTARNIGIENACGSWISLLDADDWFVQGRLSALFSSALEHQLDLIADSYYLIHNQAPSPHSSRFTTLSKPDCVTLFTGGSFVRHGLGSVKPLIKKVFLERTQIRFDPSVWHGEDMLFFVTLLLNNARFGLLNTPFYIRSETSDSLSKSDKVKLLKNLQKVFIKLQEETIALGKENHEINKALKYRAIVTKDALAAARWEFWFKNMGKKHLPRFPSLLSAMRHLLLKNKRYHNAKNSV